ncbi:MAG: hypothetical protein U0904_11775 [Candidatus Nanopelagicales bacterium]|nr:hypothetical protein [Candidatus Nanopelagicales bacterium]
MKYRSAVAAIAAAGLAVSLTALSAEAESTVSGTALAGTVVRKADLSPWFSRVRTVTAPTPGTGENRTRAAALCFKANGGMLGIRKLPGRQALSEMMMIGRSSGGISSFIAQYGSKAKAKATMKSALAKLARCPGVISIPDFTITQASLGQGKFYGGKAVGTYITIDEPGSGVDILVYDVLRRTGRALSFTTFRRAHEWPSGPPASVPAQVRSATDYLSILVASRYAAAA